MAAKKKVTGILKRERLVTEYLNTGSTQLNQSISCFKDKIGGIPTQRIIEFSGTGASGKTYICGEIAGDALRKGYHVYVDDIERRWDLSRLDTFGIEFGHKSFNYLESPSKSVEGCFAALFKTLDKHKPGSKVLYIIDPIAALYAEQEKKSDKMSQARAKALQKHFRFLKDRVAYDSDTINCVVFSNQLIDDPTAGIFGPKQKTPGGNALIHWPSVRVRFEHRGSLIREQRGRKDKYRTTIGSKIHGKVIKNSEDDCFRESDITIVNGYGIDNVRDNATWLKTHTTVLGDTDRWYVLPKSKKDAKKHPSANGLPAFIKYIEEQNLEKRLDSLTRKYYKKWYHHQSRKPKVRT